MQMKTTNIVIYQAPDGQMQFPVKMGDDSVWLTIDQMCLLFGKSRATINEHILNIFKEKELDREDVIRKIGNSDFSSKPTNHYNLDVIISVGYRVKSPQGTQFRIWANKILKEYLLKGHSIQPVTREELEEIRAELRNLELITDAQFSEIYDALIKLVSKKQLEEKPRKPIGFIHLITKV